MTPSDFKAIYPQFSEIADGKILQQFNDFELLYDKIDFDSKQDMGMGLYAAHFLTVENASVIDKNNIEEALIKGTFMDSEKTPEFQTHYTDTILKKENFDVIKQTLVNDPYSKVYGINFLYVFESDLYKTTIYGVKFIYLLWMIYQADLAKRQEEEVLRFKSAPAAIRVRMK